MNNPVVIGTTLTFSFRRSGVAAYNVGGSQEGKLFIIFTDNVFPSGVTGASHSVLVVGLYSIGRHSSVPKIRNYRVKEEFRLLVCSIS